MNKDKSIFWNSVGIDGLIVGGFLSLSLIISHATRYVGGWELVSSAAMFIGLLIAPYRLGRRFSTRSALTGLTFNRAFGYMLMMYLLGGVITGLTAFIFYRLDASYYSEMYDTIAATFAVEGSDFHSLSASPFSSVFGNAMAMPLIGFIPSLIIAFIIKRNPAIK